MMKTAARFTALLMLTGPCIALANDRLDDLEVTMDVVDDVVELESSLRELRRPGARVVAVAETDAEAAATVVEEPVELDIPVVIRTDGEVHFNQDDMGEATDAEFEAEDDFELGEEIDEDVFDELPMPMDPMDDIP